MLFENADFSFAVAKNDEVFAEKSHARRRATRFGHFFGQNGWNPKAADHFTHQRPGPDADQGCPDGCYATGSEAGQNQLLALLTCMDDAACVDVTCVETSCDPELNTCLGDSTTASGTPNPSGDVPEGDIPSELVGHWTSPGASDVTEFTFNADGTATYSAYKESGIGTCSMSVLSQWNTGSATVQGDLLTVTLADGTTSVAWDAQCGTGYTNPAGGKIFEFSYALDDSRSPPGLWLTDLSCTGDTCQTYYRKDGG